jgi:phytol kinase
VTRGDIIGLVLSYVYAFGLLFGVEAIGKGFKWRQEVTRKIVHIGAGMWIWGILYFFDHKVYGVIPFATFIVLNYVFYRFQAFKAMDTTESTLGTVYFAISITVLFVWLWRTDGSLDQVPLAAAGVMAMTWGDALASLVGLRWGNHRHTSFGHQRSWEGTATMAIVSLIVIGLTLAWLPDSGLSPHSVSPTPLWAVTLAGALVATIAEAVSPAGTDNLSVPLLSTLAMWLVDTLWLVDGAV